MSRRSQGEARSNRCNSCQPAGNSQLAVYCPQKLVNHTVMNHGVTQHIMQLAAARQQQQPQQKQRTNVARQHEDGDVLLAPQLARLYLRTKSIHAVSGAAEQQPTPPQPPQEAKPAGCAGPRAQRRGAHAVLCGVLHDKLAMKLPRTPPTCALSSMRSTLPLNSSLASTPVGGASAGCRPMAARRCEELPLHSHQLLHSGGHT